MIKRSFTSLVLAVFGFHLLTASSTPAALRIYNDISRSLRDMEVDPSGIAEVNQCTIARDAATFTFDHGFLFPLRSSGGASAVLFVGKGSFHCFPPTEVERQQVQRFYESPSVDFSFEDAFFTGTDSIVAELFRHALPSDRSVDADVRKGLKKARRYLVHGSQDVIVEDVLRALMRADRHDFLYAHVWDERESFFYSIDPYEVEEVSLSHNVAMRATIMGDDEREVVSQFHRSDEYARPDRIAEEQKTVADVSHYEMAVSFSDDLELTSGCSMTVTTRTVNTHWLHFSLYPKLIVDSVRTASGRTAEFVNIKEDASVWLYSSMPFPYDTVMTVTVFYHGVVCTEQNGWVYSEAPSLWYPRSDDYLQRSTFEMTFSVPKRFRLVGIGKNTAMQEENDAIVSRWSLAVPERNAGFSIGLYDTYTIHRDSVPVITVYSSRAHDATFSNYLAQRGVLTGSDMEQQVGADIENSFRFFQLVYGPAKYSSFSAAEVPEGHGLAFPGLIHLSWATFQNTQSDGSDEAFRAHEVAHQWWGISVNFRSYHDQWLSEAFADFSGLWYMQTVLRDNGIFFKKLSEYSESILSNRKYIFGSGQPAGPIWLGYRNQSSQTKGDYSTIVYKKGAWVLQMLRNMAIDLNTMKEDVFLRMMKDFYRTYAGSYASTEDFQRMVEKHYGIDMKWFFRQWVYGTGIPTYTVLYSKQELPGGKYRVHCTVKQTNVPDDFQMPVPFLIDFGDDRFARIRHVIRGPLTEFDFPALPLEPKEIKINDLQSVLCEVDDEDWD